MKLEFDYKDLGKNYDKKVTRHFSDMKSRFKNSSNVKGNSVLYEVYMKDFGAFDVALTVLNSGTVNGEFFMTRGHKHKKPRREIYILTKGKGKLLVQEKNSVKSVEMKKGKMYFIPPRAGHRVVNTGKERLEFLSFYSKDAGHNYNFEFRKRIFAR